MSNFLFPYYSNDQTKLNPTATQTPLACSTSATISTRKTTTGSSPDHHMPLQVQVKEQDSTNTSRDMELKLVNQPMPIKAMLSWQGLKILVATLIQCHNTRSLEEQKESANINNSSSQSSKAKYLKWKTVKETLDSSRTSTDTYKISTNRRKLRSNIWSRKTWKG